jgi:hypothetical protein
MEDDFLELFSACSTDTPPPPSMPKMKVTKEAERKAGSLAFFELKKYKFYEKKEEDDVTTLSLFGDKYKFHMDRKKKMLWMVSTHHYQQSSNFKLATRHKEWAGVFSFPRSLVADTMGKYFHSQSMEVSGGEANHKMGIQYRIVANQAYGGDKNKLARIFGGVLWKMLDREIACLAIKPFGLSASSIDYTLIWNNKEEFVDTLEKAPGILPLWREIVLVKMYNDRDKSMPVPVAHKDRSRGLDGWKYEESLDPNHPSQIATSFNYPLKATSFSFPNIVDTVKKHLEGHGLTSAAWRYLLKLPPRSVMILMRGMSGKEVVPLLNWMAAVGVVPRYSLLKPMVQNVFNQVARTDDLTALMRAGLTAAQECKRGIRQFWDNQMSMVMDWFRAAGQQQEAGYLPVVKQEFTVGGRAVMVARNQVVLDHNQRKAGWDWFMRQQEEWHRTASDKAKSKVENDSWDSALGEIEYKGYNIIPLMTTHQLIDEGKEMHHCVGSYANRCLDGYIRIFSIRKGDAKVATMELTDSFTEHVYPAITGNPKDRWKVGQIRGVCNTEPTDEMKRVAEGVARRYNKALGVHFAQPSEMVGAS